MTNIITIQSKRVEPDPSGAEILRSTKEYAIETLKDAQLYTDGASNRRVTIDASGQQFVYNSSSNLNASLPELITLKAVCSNFIPSSFKWQFYIAGAWIDIEGATGSSVIIDPNNTIYFGVDISARTFRVECSYLVRNTPGVLYDKITLSKLINGSDVLSVSLTNEAHVVVSDNNGHVDSFAGTYTDILVYKGSKKLSYHLNENTGNNYSLTYVTSGLNVELSAVNDNARISVIEMTSDNGWVDISITNNSITLTKRFSVSKSIKGDIGNDGDPGNDAITAILSNDGVVISIDYDEATKSYSVADYSSAVTSISVLAGIVDVTSSWIITAIASSGIVGSLLNNTYHVTNMSNDNGYVDIKASRDGYPVLVKRFTLSKSYKTITVVESAAKAAKDATDKLNEWASDSKISPPEKKNLRQQRADILAEYAHIESETTLYALLTSSEWSNYRNAKIEAIDALNKYTAETPETIDISTDFINISAYYNARQAILSRISIESKIFTTLTAQNAVDSIKIGGRNLLLNSSFKENLNSWSVLWGNFAVVDGALHAYSIKGRISQVVNNIVGGELYTLSFDIVGITGQFNTFIWENNGGTAIYMDNISFHSSVGRFTQVVKLQPDCTYVSILLDADVNCTYQLKNIKFERGNKVTDWSPAPEDSVNALLDANAHVEAIKADLQSQIDNVVDSWFYNYVPTLNNLPASDWTDNTKKSRHVGDTFTNTEPFVSETATPNAGKSWRFVNNNGVYSWTPIADSDAVKALLAASKAQDTADGKRRTFLNQPTCPYSAGDLWVQGVSGDIMRCITAKAAGAYDASHWEKATKYTDDTAVNNLFIGGRNLLRNTKNFIDLYHWNSFEYQPVYTAGNLVRGVRSDVWTGNENAIEVHIGSGHLISGSVGVDQRVKLIAGKQYVLSGYIAGHRSVKVVNVRREDNGQIIASQTCDVWYGGINISDWTKLDIKFTAPIAEMWVTIELNPHLNEDDQYLWLKEIKLEEGTKASAWSIAQEDVQELNENYALAKAALAEVNAKAHADGIVTAEEQRAIADATAKAEAARVAAVYAAAADATSKVNAVSVGGRNLFGFHKGVNTWGAYSTIILSPTLRGLTIDVNSSNVESIICRLGNLGTAGVGGDFVVSFFGKASKAITLNINICDVSSIEGDCNLTVDYKRFVFTFKNITQYVEEGGLNGFIDFENQQAKSVLITIKDLKIERGTKATDWTPAIEDVNTDIQTAQASANAANAAIADMASDNKLTASEKQATLREWQTIQSDCQRCLSDGATVGIDDGYDELIALYDAYGALGSYLTPLLADLNSTSDIVGTTFRAKFSDYYTNRDVLQRFILQLVDGSATAAGIDANNALLIANSIEVGGRNFVLNSATGILAKPTSTFQSLGFGMSSSVKGLSTKNTYTISFEVKPNVANAKPFSSVVVGKKGGDNWSYRLLENTFTKIASNNGYTRYVQTFTVNRPAGDLFPIDPASYDGIIILAEMNEGIEGSTFRFIQIESGNRASSYTPAVEDTDAQIAAAHAIAQESQTETNAIKNNLTTIEGGMVLTTLLKMLNNGNESAGIAAKTPTNNVAMWAGGTLAQAILKQTKYGVNHDGDAWLNSGKIGKFDIIGGKIIGRDVNGVQKISFSTDVVPSIADINQTAITLMDALNGEISGELTPSNPTTTLILTGTFYLPYATTVYYSNLGQCGLEIEEQGEISDSSFIQTMTFKKNGVVVASSELSTVSQETAFVLNQTGQYTVELELLGSVVFDQGYSVRFYMSTGHNWGCLFYRTSPTETAICSDGFYSRFGPNGFFYFKDGVGVIARGKCDIPAGLGGASVNSTGGIGSHWGNITGNGTATGNVYKSGSTYTIYHNMNDTSLSVILTPISTNIAYKSGQTANTITITCAGGFDFVLIRTK